MNNDLFTGQLVRLAAINPEADAAWFARWDRDTEYIRLLDGAPFRLIPVKKVKEEIEKEIEENAANACLFVVRTLADDRLIGFVELEGIRWPHGDTFVGIGLGDRDYWGKGYGTDAMKIVLRYAFTELNLQRVSLDVFGYNERALRSYQKAGFVIEGRQRQLLLRNGQRFDCIYMGVLRNEWLAMNNFQ